MFYREVFNIIKFNFMRVELKNNHSEITPLFHPFYGLIVSEIW